MGNYQNFFHTSNSYKGPNYCSEKGLHEKAKCELAELDLKLI